MVRFLAVALLVVAQAAPVARKGQTLLVEKPKGVGVGGQLAANGVYDTMETAARDDGRLQVGIDEHRTFEDVSRVAMGESTAEISDECENAPCVVLGNKRVDANLILRATVSGPKNGPFTLTVSVVHAPTTIEMSVQKASAKDALAVLDVTRDAVRSALREAFRDPPPAPSSPPPPAKR